MSSFLGAPLPGTLSSPSVGGVVNSGDLLVSQNGTPNMSVNVAGGQVWIPGTTAANQSLYYGLNDATVNLAISASNPTNPRIDLIVATVNDAAYSGSTNNWVLQVITGTPTAGATLANLLGAAALPASSLLIAYVLVPANATSIVTADLADKRPYVLIAGQRLSGSDSGWITPAANAGWTSNIQYRKQGNVVRLRLNALRVSGVIGGPFTLPAGFTPPAQQEFVGVDLTPAAAATITVATSGVVTVNTTDNVFYDNVSFTVD